MPPRRRGTATGKRQPRRNTRGKPGRTPVWLWLIGGIGVGAVLAVALFFQDAPRGGGRDTDTAGSKSSKKAKPKPVAERNFQLQDLHDVPATDKPEPTGTATVATAPPVMPTKRRAVEPEKAKPKPSARPTTTPKPRSKPSPRQTAKAGKGPRYWLQAGAFRSESQADNLKARLILSGLPVRVIRAQVKGRTWYRVRIGPYRDKTRLNRAKGKLRQQKIQASVITERR